MDNQQPVAPNPQPAPVAGPNPSSKADQRTSWLIGAVVVVIIAAVAACLFLYKHHQDQQKAKAATEPYAYSYKALKSYKLPGQASGSGMTFSLPSQLTASGPPASAHQLEVSFSQQLSANKQNEAIANLGAASVYSAAPPTSYLKSLASNLAAPSSANYVAAAKPIEDFATSRTVSTYGLNFAKAQTFKNPSITTNAWSINFTATAKKGASHFPGPALSGEVILLAGKNAFYYYYVDAVSYNWTANQAVWQQALNSIKIDQ